MTSTDRLTLPLLGTAAVALLMTLSASGPLVGQHADHSHHATTGTSTAAEVETAPAGIRSDLQAVRPAGPERVGTLVVAHGGSAEWNAPVREVVEAVGTDGPVELALLMGDFAPEFRFQDRVRALVEAGATRIVVVPLLASSHSGHYEQIRYLVGEVDELSEVMMHHLHMSGITRPEVGVPLRLTPSVDASPELADALTDRALALLTEPEAEALYIIGHGPNSAEDHAEWMANLRPIAEEVGRRTGVRDVKVGLVRDDAPEAVRAEAVRKIRETIQLQSELTGRSVVVVPILISKGYLSTVKIPRDLVGLDVVYEGEGLVPHPTASRWIERRTREAWQAFTAEEES